MKNQKPITHTKKPAHPRRKKKTNLKFKLAPKTVCSLNPTKLVDKIKNNST